MAIIEHFLAKCGYGSGFSSDLMRACVCVCVCVYIETIQLDNLRSPLQLIVQPCVEHQYPLFAHTCTYMHYMQTALVCNARTLARLAPPPNHVCMWNLGRTQGSLVNGRHSPAK